MPPHKRVPNKRRAKELIRARKTRDKVLKYGKRVQGYREAVGDAAWFAGDDRFNRVAGSGYLKNGAKWRRVLRLEGIPEDDVAARMEFWDSLSSLPDWMIE